MRHAVIAWSAVSSVTPHSKVAKETRPQFCVHIRKRLTPFRRRLSLIQAHSKGPSTGLSNENKVHGCAFRVLRAPLIICPLNRANAQHNHLIVSVQHAQMSV